MAHQAVIDLGGKPTALGPVAKQMGVSPQSAYVRLRTAVFYELVEYKRDAKLWSLAAAPKLTKAKAPILRR